MEETITEQLAESDKALKLVKEIVGLQYRNLEQATIERVKLLFLDTIGVAISGSNAQGFSELLNLFRGWKGGKCRVLVSGLKLSPPDAAFLNGVLIHAWDFDDTHDLAKLHANSSVVPAIISASEIKGRIDGKAIILALAIGLSFNYEIALAIPLKEGWHHSGVFGSLAATVAAGKVLDLTPKELLNAFGFAYSQLSGNLQCLIDGALAKRMQPGFGARNGILSALMGKVMDCSVNLFQGKYGISQLYGDGSKRSEEIDFTIASMREIQEPSIKPYPCCRLIHPCLDGVLTLKETHKFKGNEVEAVKVFVGDRAYRLVGGKFQLGDTPQVNAQFNIPYPCSVALLNGKVTLNDFEEEQIRKNRKALELAKRIQVLVDVELEDQEISLPVRVEVKLKSGDLYKATISKMKGSTTHPLSMEEMKRKFEECVFYSRKKKLSKNILLIEDAILNLEQLRDFSELIDLLT
ncbi:MAG: MmgE/PrpD family protein [Candidatus Hodarchaeota archaeon]